MIFTGSLVVAADRARVWETLLDVDAVAQCVPGIQAATQIDPQTFDGIVEATVGPISGTFSFRAQIVDSEPPSSLVSRIAGSDSVTRSRINGEASVTLQALDPDRTELNYHASVSVSGRLAILGEIVLRATGNLLLNETAERLKRRIESGTAS